MIEQDIELSIAQLERSLEKSAENKYSDPRKRRFAGNLYNLFTLIKAEDRSGYSLTQLQTTKKYVDFIYSHLTFLDFSTLTVIPYELVSCLEQALEEWIPNGNYIVVTSLESDLLSYMVNGAYALDEPLFLEIETRYNISFENRLIQIMLPKHYVRDYLVNVVLYHELGHFIDYKYSISELTVTKKYLRSNLSRDEFEHLTNQYMEYFADIFAAQYVAASSNHFLNYIAHKHPKSFTHPATDDRIKMVEDFLSGTKNDIIHDLEVTLGAVSPIKNFAFRSVNLDNNDFFNLIPMELNENEIHSVFVLGWDIWLDNTSELRTKFDSFTAYKIINNLIEKSLSNHFVNKHWNS